MTAHLHSVPTETVVSVLGAHGPNWRKHAACKGLTALMYPQRGEDVEPAKAVCRSCPVLADCREEALAKPEPWGVLGGMSGNERKAMRRALAAERAAS